MAIATQRKTSPENQTLAMVMTTNSITVSTGARLSRYLVKDYNRTNNDIPPTRLPDR